MSPEPEKIIPVTCEKCGHTTAYRPPAVFTPTEADRQARMLGREPQCSMEWRGLYERPSPADGALDCGCNPAVNHTCERHSTMPMEEK